MNVVALLSGCLVYMLGAMSRVAVPGMIFERIVADYGLKHAQVALLPSVGVFGCMAFIGLGGVAVDRFGWKRMLLLGSLLQAFGYIPVHESSNLGLMLAGEFLNGGGRTIVYLSILKLFDVSFDRRSFAALIGIFYIFSYGGTLGASAVFPALESCCGSWQAAARAINYGTLGCTALIAATACRRGMAGPASDAPVREAFPWRAMARSFADPVARRAILVAGLNIAVYWSFLCVAAAPFARGLGHASLVSEMNTVVMCGMVFMGSVSLLLGNRRRPFFVWGAGALAAGFAVLLAASLLGAQGGTAYRTAYLLVGAGYGVTSVLLAGTKECVPPVYMASAIGFTNFLANIVQICGNQASGHLMQLGTTGYPWIFGLYLALACASLACALRLCASGRPSTAESGASASRDGGSRACRAAAAAPRSRPPVHRSP